MRLTLLLIAAAALLLPFVLISAEEKTYTPTLPQLHVKLAEGKARVVKPGSDDALDEKAQKALLEQHAAHVDEGNGWKGRGADGISENPLVLHVDAMADQREVGKVVANAADKMIYRVVVGIPEHTDNPLKGGKAPDLEKLETGYIHFDLPKDEGLQDAPAVPKEEITLYLAWDADAQGGNFIVAIDARGRKPVENSWITADELKSKDAKRRNEVRDAAKKQVQEHIARSGAKIERLSMEVSGGERAEAPWALTELGYRAALAVNEERAKNKENALTIVLPFLRDVAEPPPPEQPPEKPVEYPKDEPEEVKPTEDERTVPDGKDEGRRNSSDRSNGDLAENPEDDVRDPQWEREAREREVHFKHRKRVEGTLRANEDRVTAALVWLQDHQNRNGYWSAKDFADDTTRKAASSTGNIEFTEDCPDDTGWEGTCDIGLTGLALLAYSGAGYTHKDGDYRPTCRQAILYLRKVQDNDGCFGSKEDDHFVYNHAIAAMAMADIYGLSGDPVLKPIVEKAIEFVVQSQNPGLGWRYGVQPGTNDSSITSWMVLALHTAVFAGMKADLDKTIKGATAWYAMVTVNVDGEPKTGYDVPGSNNARLRVRREWEHNPTLDAVYVKCMLAMGKADKQDATVQALAAKCVKADALPQWELHKIDFYYWYYATRALRAIEGDNWKTWETAVTKVLTENQRGFSKLDQDAKRTRATNLDEHGSWDPVGAWGTAGGRVYSTAMGALTLEAAWHID
ncbi:MAG: hypothetical protein ICCCNLDF_02682 [Planctomycetes bacterium]|nr:hypothetical protein [Planctomycetota bacterium]